MTKQEQAQFDALYLKNYKRLLNMGTGYLGSADRAEELVQDTFLKYLSCMEDADRVNTDGWLTNTMRNLLRNETKRSSRSERSLDEFNDFRAPEPEEPFELILPQSLTPSERQLLIWYFKEQLTHEEMAARLHISESACRARLLRAKRRCQELFLKNF